MKLLKCLERIKNNLTLFPVIDIIYQKEWIFLKILKEFL